MSDRARSKNTSPQGTDKPFCSRSWKVVRCGKVGGGAFPSAARRSPVFPPPARGAPRGRLVASGVKVVFR
eukprot:3072443-Lingulodinium_polyedra.AAC.1